MSWVADKAVLQIALSNLGYGEVSEDENAQDQPFPPHQHFFYKLEKIGAEGLGLTSKASAYAHKILLECFYINNQNHDKDENADSFDAVMEGIIGLNGFGGEVTNNFEDIDEDHSKGTFEFYYGFETC